MDQLGSQAAVFLLGDRARRLELVELHDLVSSAETDDMAQFLPGLVGRRSISLRHAPSLREKIGEHAEVGEQDERDHPEPWRSRTRHAGGRDRPTQR